MLSLTVNSPGRLPLLLEEDAGVSVPLLGPGAEARSAMIQTFPYEKKCSQSPK